MPQTRSRRKKKDPEDIKELGLYDRAVKGIFTILDGGYNDRLALNSKDEKFRGILNRELEITKGYTKGHIVDFIYSLKLDGKGQKSDKESKLNPASNDLFTKNINDIFTYFQDIYRNKFIEMTDLKFIAKFIPALGEAVKTVLDAVVASDNIADTINFKIELPAGVSPEDETAILNEIHRMEDEVKLRKKLKNIVYNKALVTGMHYVYAVSYDRIFEEYDAIKKKHHKDIKDTAYGNYVDMRNLNIQTVAKEQGFAYTLGDNIDITPAMENVRDLLTKSEPVNPKAGQKHLSDAEVKTVMSEFYDSLPQITVESDMGILQEAYDEAEIAMESSGVFEAFQNARARKTNGGKYINDRMEINPLELKVPDGTVGQDHKVRPTKFNIGGTYIKYIDPKQLIPLKVFDQVVGYYLIHPKAKKNKNSSAGEVTGINSIGNTLFSAVNIGETKKHDAVQRIVDTISDGILNSFDKKFATKNTEYKKLIADVIIANGLTDKDYNIQFIPESDIIPFTIQENEEGFGESILRDSLFPAKLLLSMIVTRMLNYINKTGNKTIAHIHRNPINAFDHNHIQRIIRDIQDQDVTFNDLLSPNLVFNKFNRDGNMVIPTARNGDRVVEFEIQEGQQIDMNPEYEKELENMAILGTGVPSVIMEYAGSADFAKQLVSANIKFAGRVATLQSDLEDPTTDLYRKLCMNSNLTDEQKAICAQSLEIKLPRPRVLLNSNNSDYISNIVQAAEAIADLMLGRDSITNTEMYPDGARIKELLMKSIVKHDSPFFEWEEFEKMMSDAILDVNQEKIERDLNQKKDPSGSDDMAADGLRF